MAKTPVNKRFDEVLRRLKEMGKFDGLDDLATKIGIGGKTTYSNITGGHQKPTIDILDKMGKLWGVSSDYIISGKGDMFITEVGKSRVGKRLDIPPMAQQMAEKKIPVYGAQAMAGNEYEADMTPLTIPDDYMSADDLDIARICDAVIYVWGNSMTPQISPGTKLGLELNYDNFFVWGEVALIETRSNRLIKRIFPSDKGDGWISCHSDNTMLFETGPRKGTPYYPPIEIPVSDIIRKYDVVASQKMHKTSRVQQLRHLRETH